MRHQRGLLAGLIGLVALAGCEATVSLGHTGSSKAEAREVSTSATFTTEPSAAMTYDPELVPAGARGAVRARSGDGSTTVMLAVRGLEPERLYGAHVHTEPCGPQPEDAGPRFQREVDPEQPSVDPHYANPENEIWLDVITDATGAGSAETVVAWELPDDRRPGSVLIHATGTNTGPGVAGTAGAHAACVTVDF
jgi:superoxide dismutase, Cu-Zn family